MSSSLRALFVFSAIFASVCIADDVVVGTSDNFDSLVKNNKFVLAEFYAPWCGHCKNLEPEYSKAAATLKSAGSDVKLVKVDVTEEKELGEKHDVQGFPTLKWFREGKSSDYSGGRDHDAIVSWVKKKSGPPARQLANAAAVDAFAKEGDAVLLGLFKEGDADLKEFEKAAAALDDVQAGYTADADLAAKYAPAKAVMLQNFDDKLVKFEGKMEAAEIQKFAQGNSMPLVISFSTKTQGKIFGESAPKKHLLALYAEGYADKANIERELAAVAKEHRGSVLVITVEKTSDNDGVFNFFGVSDVTKPKIVSIDQSTGSMKKYFYDGELEHRAMKAWMADVLASKVSPNLKSEEEPATNPGPVKVVVGKTFKKEVTDSGKDVLIQFFAPWCGHCKALEPEFKQVGDEFKGVSSVVIAKIDATANEVDVPGVDVQGFPSLYFFKSGAADKPIKYKGGRTHKELSQFVRDNVGTPIPTGHGDKKEL
jgi:protein disulfide-isomerase A1